MGKKADLSAACSARVAKRHVNHATSYGTEVAHLPVIGEVMQYVTTPHSLRVFLDATIESDIGFTLPVMWRKRIRSGIKSVILDGSGLDGLAKSGLAWLVEAQKTMAILQVEVVLAYMPIDSIRWGGNASFQMLLPGVTGQHVDQHEGVAEQMLVDIELLTSDHGSAAAPSA